MTLVLDAGALIAVERSDRQALLLLKAARESGREMVIPAGVIGQVWRGARQARLAALLNARQATVVDLTGEVARAAGVLCGASGTSDVIDATVVLAARRHHADILSSDRADIEQLDSTLTIIDC